jgi:GT2 family glycosyltransferase
MTTTARYHRIRRAGHGHGDGERCSVDVCVPVHNALEDVQRCLTSVAATRPRGSRIVVVDDGSRGEAAEWLARFRADHEDVTLLRNEDSIGYTRSANLLLEESQAEFAVLLNSDAVVAPGWVQKLVGHARATPDVGLVGPLSNAASWQSVPAVKAGDDRPGYAVNELPAGWTVGDMDFVVAALEAIVRPRVPLLNGFCTLIRRELFKQLGGFDADTFPRGYGEEDDFCLRASDLGAALVVATDAYVFHAKSRSFTPEGRLALARAGGEALRRKHSQRRVDNAVRTMRENPVLAEKRQLVNDVVEAVKGNVPHGWTLAASRELPPELLAALAAVTRGGAAEEIASPESAPLDARTVDAAALVAISEDRRASLTSTTSDDAITIGLATAAPTAHPLQLTGSPRSDRIRLAALLQALNHVGLEVDAAPIAQVQRSAPAVPAPSAPPARTPPAHAAVGDGQVRRYLASFDAHPAALAASRRITDHQRARREADLSTVIWFVPAFDHILRGGVRTAFVIAADLATHFETRNLFVLCGDQPADLSAAAAQAAQHFPGVDLTFESLCYGDDPARLPAADTAICTLWTTAYVMLHYNQCTAKYYLVQDWEPNFYPAGTMSGLIEQTYQFGFPVLANSAGVAERCRQFENWVQSFTPGVDTELFRPDLERTAGPPFRVVFYGRPRNPRNGFELGVEALRLVKADLGDDVDIVSVGGAFDERSLGLDGVLRNAGVLTRMGDVAELYRSAHVGLVFMYSAHPSYQPLEYMASGCATVTNHNPSNAWLLRDEDNCALAAGTVCGVASRVLDVLHDTALHDRIVRGGLETARTELSWPRAMSAVRDFLRRPAPARGSFLPPPPGSGGDDA